MNNNQELLSKIETALTRLNLHEEGLADAITATQKIRGLVKNIKHSIENEL